MALAGVLAFAPMPAADILVRILRDTPDLALSSEAWLLAFLSILWARSPLFIVPAAGAASLVHYLLTALTHGAFPRSPKYFSFLILVSVAWGVRAAFCAWKARRSASA